MTAETRAAGPSRPPSTSHVAGLRCRRCGRPEPLGARLRLYRPASDRWRSYTTLPSHALTLTRETVATRPAGIWRYLELLPVETAPRRGLAVGGTALVAADRLAATLGIGRLWLKDDSRNPTLSFKDRVVALAAARAVEFGFDTLACASTGNLAGATAAAAAALGLRSVIFIPADLEPAKVAHALAYGATVVPVRRHLRRGQSPLARDRRRVPVGVRERERAALLRGGQQDARVRDRRAAGLAAARRDRGAARFGLALRQGRKGGRRSWSRSGSWSPGRSASSAARPRAARPIASAFGAGAATVIGRFASRTRSSSRSRSATRPTARTRSSWRAPAAGRIEAVPDEATAARHPARR